MSGSRHVRSGGAGPVLAMVSGAALIGTNAMMVSLAGTAPTVSAFWRLLFSAPILWLYLALRGGWVALSGEAFRWSLMAGALFAADLWFWHRSILLIGPGLSTLLGNTQVFFLAAAGWVLLGERISGRFVAGLVLSFFGLWLLLAGGSMAQTPGYRTGVWMGVATGISYAGYSLVLRRAQLLAGGRRDRMAATAEVLCIAALAGAALLALAAIVEGHWLAIPDLRAGVLLVLLAALGHCLSWILISSAMTRLPIGLVGLLLLVQPVVAYGLDILVFQRPTTTREWVGLGIALLGIFVAGVRGRSDRVGD